MILLHFKKRIAEITMLNYGKRTGMAFPNGIPILLKKVGIAILFHPELKAELLDTQMVKIDNCTFQILNIYVPNHETQEAVESFIHDVQYYLDPW